MNAICQRCGAEELAWTLTQASFDVGKVQHWKVHLCRACTQVIETAILAELSPRVKA